MQETHRARWKWIINPSLAQRHSLGSHPLRPPRMRRGNATPTRHGVTRSASKKICVVDDGNAGPINMAWNTLVPRANKAIST